MLRWLNGISNSMGDGEEEGGMVCCSSWCRRIGHDLATEQQQQFALQVLLSKGSLTDMHRSQYHGTGFGEKKELYCKMDQQGDRRQGSNLSQSRIMTKKFGEFQTWKLIG